MLFSKQNKKMPVHCALGSRPVWVDRPHLIWYSTFILYIGNVRWIHWWAHKSRFIATIWSDIRTSITVTECQAQISLAGTILMIIMNLRSNAANFLIIPMVSYYYYWTINHSEYIQSLFTFHSHLCSTFPYRNTRKFRIVYVIYTSKGIELIIIQ